jgi:polysaccharide deacetylase
MWRKRIQRMVEKNQKELLGILLRRYPAFILRDSVDEAAGVPTFAFHDVTWAALEPMLRFLSNNGYATLTADEYVERQVQPKRRRQREVLLTFDDGLNSLYTVVYPALKRFGLKAVAYIVPGRMAASDRIAQGNAFSDAERLCSWDAVQEMHESGAVDFQSHSLYHHSISTSTRVVDFVRPAVKFSFLDSDLAPLPETKGELDGSEEPAYGTPIYEWNSRFTETAAFQESRVVILACVQHVKRNGGAEYFKRRDWSRRLRKVLGEARSALGEGGGRFETDDEQRRAILQDLLDSKREIERRLPGKIVRHFCYPWYRGSRLAAQLSAQAGYISNAWASLTPRFVRREQHLAHIARLPPFYLWRLPGKERKPLGEVLRERLLQIYPGRFFCGVFVWVGLTHDTILAICP